MQRTSNMPRNLRDVLLSFCPEAVRKTFRPESSLFTLRAATWTGFFQFLLLGYLAALRYKTFFITRAQQLAPHVAGASETVQAGVAIVISLEFLLYPVSILLLYFAMEGFIRFLGGLLTSEIAPSLPVAVAFRLTDAIERRRQDRQNRLLPPDTIEILAGDRLRIATASPKVRWNQSITIGVRGRWYEVEAQEEGTADRRFVYVLRPAPVSKVLRGYDEYDVDSASNSAGSPADEKPSSPAGKV
jgi:hypothetical protein